MSEALQKMPMNKLVRLVGREYFEFVQTTDGECFAIPKKGPAIPLKVGSEPFTEALASAVNQETKEARMASRRVIDEASLLFRAEARKKQKVRSFIRYATHNGKTYVDLGDATGRCVEVSEDGWRYLTVPPVVFRRSRVNLPMVEPLREGGDANLIFDVVNISPEKRPMFLAWMVSAFFPEIPHPIARFDGEMGSGKSRAGAFAGQILDPSDAEVRGMPREGEQWVDAVHGTYYVPLDNVSKLSPAMSDQLCRAVTGDAELRRRKYSDDDQFLFRLKLLISMNGINILGIREDLAERILNFEMEVVPSNRRLTETDLNRSFSMNAPSILGGLLDLVVAVRRRMGTIKLEHLPRMADYAVILKAVDEELGTDGLEVYLHDLESAAITALAEEPFLKILTKVITEPFEGTSQDLLTRLVNLWKDAAYAYNLDEVPRRPIWVTNQLKRFAPALRKSGWAIHDLGNRNHSKIKRWKITPPPAPRMKTHQEMVDAGIAGAKSITFSSLLVEEK